MEVIEVITVWKDGTWTVWSKLDAHYAANDPDWLVNIPISEVAVRPHEL